MKRDVEVLSMRSALRYMKAYDRFVSSYNKRDRYLKWRFTKPNRKKLVGRNYCGKNIMRMELYPGGSIKRPGQITTCFMRDWSGEYGPRLRLWDWRYEE